MAHAPHICALDALKNQSAQPYRHALQRADCVVDDASWGELPIAELQARLEIADDFAVLMLATKFTTAAPLEGLLVEVTAAGLRNLTVDGNYLVPLKSSDASVSQYRMPSPLPAGCHALAWSYVWNPPKDKTSGDAVPGGVALRAPHLCGGFTVVDDVLHGPPTQVLVTTLHVPAWPVALHLEGPSHGNVRMLLGGEVLQGSADLPYHAALPPALVGAQELRIEFLGAPEPVTLLRLDPA